MQMRTAKIFLHVSNIDIDMSSTKSDMGISMDISMDIYILWTHLCASDYITQKHLYILY